MRRIPHILTGVAICAALAPKPIWAQQVVWDRTFGGADFDVARSVQQTSDGGYILAGHTDSYGVGEGDVWLIKTNSEGVKLWDRTFGGADFDAALSVQQASDGGYMVVGETNSYGSGEEDAWLIKTGSEGRELWDRTFGGADFEEAFSVQQTSDGGYIVAGYTRSDGAGKGDAWLIKTNSTGEKLWDHTFGGTEYDGAKCVQQTSDGGYIVACETFSYGAGECDVWLIKTDSAGEKLWDRTFGGASGEYFPIVQQTSDGSYIVTGYTESYGAGKGDAWLIKIIE